MKCIQFEYEEKYINDFLKLPKRLYTKKEITEVSSEVKEILLGTHMLMKYVEKFYKFIVYNDRGKAVARFAITTVKDDKNAYIGFFECIENYRIANFAFKKAFNFVEELGYEKIIGPVDLNMWYKYRLKINRFDKVPYTGEPYNKEYYYDMFKNSGFVVKDTYYTNTYEKFRENFRIGPFEKRYNYFIDKGYEIRNITIDEWDDCIGQVYELIMELYSNFNTFIKLDKEDFIKQFDSYKKILDMDFVTMAFYEGKIVGFSISVPNYNNAVYNLAEPSNIIKILRTKKRAKEYMIMYMGVDEKHRGLARALTYVTIKEFRKKDATCMGALIKKGVMTNNFINAKLKFSYEYVLMEKTVNGGI